MIMGVAKITNRWKVGHTGGKDTWTVKFAQLTANVLHEHPGQRHLFDAFLGVDENDELIWNKAEGLTTYCGLKVAISGKRCPIACSHARYCKACKAEEAIRPSRRVLAELTL